MNYVVTVITMSSVMFGTLSLPSKHNRRSATSNSQNSLLVRTSLRDEALVTEQEIGSHCVNYSQTYMSLFKLGGREAATCNDGSASGYYLLRQPGSRKWVVYLEGGWYCANEKMCKLRKLREPALTSSRYWFSCKQGRGIFSTLPSENPHLFDSNMVYIPYCSSDVWSGTARNRRLGDETFSFMGSVIIEQVIRKLIENHGMRDASIVLLVGSSAGGTGVFLNVDRVQSIINRENVAANVRGIVDSGWYLKRPKMDNDRHCNFQHGCSPVAMIKLGASLWQPNLPRKCTRKYRNGRRLNSINSSRRWSRDETWKCYFGPIVHPYIEAEVFIIQWLFDSVQLHSDNINLMGYRQSTQHLLKYVEDLYEGLRKSFNNVKGVFATSCLAHTVLDNSDWRFVSVARVFLPDAIQCWEMDLDSTNGQQESIDIIDNDVESHRNSINGQRRHHRKRTTELYNSKVIAKRGMEYVSELVPDDDDDYADAYYTSNYLADTPEPMIEVSQCRQKIIDPCPLPQCNPSCPPFYDQQSHSFVNAIDFLEHLGIDIRSMASREGSNAAQLLSDLSDG